jgi:hypothetical protein
MFLGSLLVLSSTLYFLYQSHWPGPVIDFWSFMPALEAFYRGEDLWAHLLKPHGGNRLVVPRLFYLAEYWLFGGRNVFLIACSLTLQAVVAGLLIRCSWKEREALSRTALHFLTGATVMLLFSATQLENFARTWNLHWFLAFAAMTTALFALVRASQALAGGGRKAAVGAHLALCVAAAVVSSYSMVNGLLAWPILILLGFILRCPVRWLLLFAATGLAVGGAFFVDYYPGPGIDRAELLRAPMARLQWVAACLGTPLSWLSPAAGTALGAVGLIAAVALSLRFALVRPVIRRLEALHLGLLLFSLGTGFMTALGRMRYSDALWHSPRYQTFALILWLNLIALALIRPVKPANSHRLRQTLLMAAAAVWMVAVLLPAHFREGRANVAFGEKARAANLAIAVGIEHRRSYSSILPFKDRGAPDDSVMRHVEFLREHGLGMFAGGEQHLLGRRVGEQLAISESQTCSGELTKIERIGGRALKGAVLSGWAWDRRRRSMPAPILIADQSGRVIGLGERRRRTLGLFRGAFPRADLRGWIAYARPPGEGEGLEVWGLLSQGEVCAIAGPAKIGPAGPRRGRNGKPAQRTPSPE